VGAGRRHCESRRPAVWMRVVLASQAIPTQELMLGAVSRVRALPAAKQCGQLGGADGRAARASNARTSAMQSHIELHRDPPHYRGCARSDMHELLCTNLHRPLVDPGSPSGYGLNGVVSRCLGLCCLRGRGRRAREAHGPKREAVWSRGATEVTRRSHVGRGTAVWARAVLRHGTGRYGGTARRCQHGAARRHGAAEGSGTAVRHGGRDRYGGTARRCHRLWSRSSLIAVWGMSGPDARWILFTNRRVGVDGLRGDIERGVRIQS
jgi:hypothetical protein